MTLASYRTLCLLFVYLDSSAPRFLNTNHHWILIRSSCSRPETWNVFSQHILAILSSWSFCGESWVFALDSSVSDRRVRSWGLVGFESKRTVVCGLNLLFVSLTLMTTASNLSFCTPKLSGVIGNPWWEWGHMHTWPNWPRKLLDQSSVFCYNFSTSSNFMALSLFQNR